MTFELHPDLDRDGIAIGDFPLSHLLMINDAAYPWFVLVPRRTGISDLHELSEDDHFMLVRESRILSTAIMAVFDGYKMNVAALGNMTPQLHVHHIVRFKDDAAWPGPIWGVQPHKTMTQANITARTSRVVAALRDHTLAFTALS